MNTGRKQQKTTRDLASGDTAGFRLLISFWSVFQCWWQQKDNSCYAGPFWQWRVL